MLTRRKEKELAKLIEQWKAARIEAAEWEVRWRDAWFEKGEDAGAVRYRWRKHREALLRDGRALEAVGEAYMHAVGVKWPIVKGATLTGG